MCYHIRRIINKYTGKTLYVPCGHCKPCLQSKASSRASKIRNHHFHTFDRGYTCYFITLTYDNAHVPFICRDQYDFMLEDELPNENKFSRVPVNVMRGYADKPGFKILSTVYCERSDLKDFSLRYLQKDGLHNTRIGVIYRPDVFNFVKRLRYYIKQNYGYSKISYFMCSEYGPTTHRPHFHLLVWSKLSLPQFRRSVCSAWTFADKGRTARYVEIARQPSDYVASYLNGSLSLPPLLKSEPFKMSCSHSKGFGFGLDAFRFSSIYKKYLERRLVVYSRHFNKEINGRQDFDFVYPQYVTHRYIPFFVGHSRFDDASFFKFIYECSSGIRPVNYIREGERYDDGLFPKIVSFVRNKYLQYALPLNISPYDYALFCRDFRNSLASHLLYMGHYNCIDGTEIDIMESYDNIIDYYTSDVINLHLDENVMPYRFVKFETDPVCFARNIADNALQEEKFFKFDKSRKIKEFCQT